MRVGIQFTLKAFHLCSSIIQGSVGEHLQSIFVESASYKSVKAKGQRSSTIRPRRETDLHATFGLQIII